MVNKAQNLVIQHFYRVKSNGIKWELFQFPDGIKKSINHETEKKNQKYFLP